MTSFPSLMWLSLGYEQKWRAFQGPLPLLVLDYRQGGESPWAMQMRTASLSGERQSNTPGDPWNCGLPYKAQTAYTSATVWVRIQHLPCLLSRFSRVWVFATPWTVAHQAPLPMGFSRHEFGSGLPFPPPWDLPNPGIELVSLSSPALAGKFFATSTTWEAPSTWLKPLLFEDLCWNTWML